MSKARPEIKKDLIKQIKVKFPEETAMLTNAETVEWALKKVLGVSQ